MYKIFDTLDEVSHYTAHRLLRKVQAKPHAKLGLATGSTMEPVYARLVSLFQQGLVDVSQLTTFNLDEYVGLNAEHTQNYSYYMYQHLFSKLSFPMGQVNLPASTAVDIEHACLIYSEKIQAASGLDIQLLGIRSNGHIDFNEPYTCFSSRTHIIELSEQTRTDNGRFFIDQSEVPTYAITMGIQDILDAKEIVLVATGRKKAKIIAELFHSAVDEALPATALKQHQNVTIVLDREAGSLI